MTSWARKNRPNRDLHFLTEDGRVACNPRDREAAHRAEVEGIATDDARAVTCKKCRVAIRSEGGLRRFQRSESPVSSADLEKARVFVQLNARLIDRHRFTFHFDNGPPDSVLCALLPYQNRDGGFGHALEPDLRSATSQPVPTEHALTILDEIGNFDLAIAGRCCDWLASVTTEEGGVPCVLPTVHDAPHAPWWKPKPHADVNPTAGIAGLLSKHHIDHPWIARATDYCWRALSGDGLQRVGPDDAISVLRFLEHTPERDRAAEVFQRLAERIRSNLVTLDPEAAGYVKTPLDFAPRPESDSRTLFDDRTIGLHLDALESQQQSDGGWPTTWKPPSEVAVLEWRGFKTIEWLGVLKAYGRLR